MLADREVVRGLAWGRPRPSHPEGSVGRHVEQLLELIDEWGETGARRRELRLLAILHDAFKHAVDRDRPRTGDNHHAMIARRFAERYIADERLLSVLEHHDRPYALWRRLQRTGRLQETELERMIGALPDAGLFLRFVELDTSVAGKRGEPVEWLRGELTRRGALTRSGASTG